MEALMKRRRDNNPEPRRIADNNLYRSASNDSDESSSREATGRVSVAILEKMAAELGITTRLRRLSAAGLLAPPRGVGRGRAQGRDFSYPPRAVKQVTAIGEARAHGSHPRFLRHWIWWATGAGLGNWALWRRDRVLDLVRQARAWNVPAQFGEEPFDERERLMEELATHRGRSPVGLPSLWKRIPHRADRETLARLLSSLVLRDDVLTPLAGSPDPQTAVARLERVLAEPIDPDPDTGQGETIGQLLDRAMHVDGAQNRGHVSGTLASAMLAFLPDPRDAPRLMAAMTQERAMQARDVCIASLIAQPGRYELTRREPLVAAQGLLMWERMTALFPHVLDQTTHA